MHDVAGVKILILIVIANKLLHGCLMAPNSTFKKKLEIYSWDMNVPPNVPFIIQYKKQKCIITFMTPYAALFIMKNRLIFFICVKKEIKS